VKILPAKTDAWSFGRDIAVIILGVLVALGFDGWVAERGDRALEVQYLSRLARDLRGDSVALAQYRGSAEAGERAARELLGLLGQRNEATPATSIARLFSDATRNAYLTPNSPTIDELQSTGNIRVIRESATRDAILTYYTEVTSFQRMIETVMRRGKDPLGDVGWDIRAFDPSIAYAVSRGDDSIPVSSTDTTYSLLEGGLLRRLQNHEDAERATHRAITYNAMLQSTLATWEQSLAFVMARVLEDQSQ
jgi:hypothetical protein